MGGIRVLVSGANGKVGREIVKGILAEPTLKLVGGAVGSQHGLDEDIGVLVGQQPVGIKLSPDLLVPLLAPEQRLWWTLLDRQPSWTI